MEVRTEAKEEREYLGRKCRKRKGPPGLSFGENSHLWSQTRRQQKPIKSELEYLQKLREKIPFRRDSQGFQILCREIKDD